MKKGELKKIAILGTAEMLFFQKGYSQTSVQDILDTLALSKGGFYHHFSSKEAILREICTYRTDRSLRQLEMELYAARTRPMDQMNLVLRAVNLFEREEPSFVAMMLKLCYRDGDVAFFANMRQSVMRRLEEYIGEVLNEGMIQGAFFTRHPAQMGSIVLSIVADASERSAQMLLESLDMPERIIDIADMLNASRDAVETLINAPFGSIELFDPAKLVRDYRAVAEELLKLEV